MRIRLTAPADTAQVTADTAARRISGMLLPYGTTGRPSVGPSQITVTADADIQVADGIVLNLEHDPGRPIGRSIRVAAGDDGLLAEFSIANTTLGSDALVEAAEGLRAGLSIEADNVEGEDRSGVFHITAARITEAALVRRPAFDAATVTHVAATAATNTEQGEPMSDESAVAEQTAQVEAAQAPTTTPIPVPRLELSERMTLPTASQYIRAMLGTDDRARMASMAQQIKAAAPHTFVENIPGLIPEPLVGPVISLAVNEGEVYRALGMYRAPSKKFDLQVISPNLPAAESAAEKTDITEQLGVIDVPVALTFVKRAVNLSAEAISASDETLVDISVAELAGAMLAGIEGNVIVPALEATTGTNTAVSIAADGSDAWAKLAMAQATHYQACGKRADLFVCAPDVWGKLAGFTNLVSQPIIGTVEQNLAGSWGTLFGIPVVVGHQLTAGKGFLVSRYGVKSWNMGQIDMRVVEPTIQGYSLSSGQYVGLSVASGKFITPVSVAA